MSKTKQVNVTLLDGTDGLLGRMSFMLDSITLNHSPRKLKVANPVEEFDLSDLKVHTCKKYRLPRKLKKKLRNELNRN